MLPCSSSDFTPPFYLVNLIRIFSYSTCEKLSGKVYFCLPMVEKYKKKPATFVVLDIFCNFAAFLHSAYSTAGQNPQREKPIAHI